MGGLAVLHPQDCLIDGHKSLINSHMKPHRNPNPNNPNPTRLKRRKRSPEKKSNNNKSKSRQTMADNFPSKNLVMGQVKILKRGGELTVLMNRGDEKPPEKIFGDLDDLVLEELTVLKNRGDEERPQKMAVDLDDLVLSSMGRLGPEPEMVPKQMRLGDFYAGSAFIESPPPSSLPLPAFFAKNSLKDDTSSDLRRLLRLDLP